MSQTPFKACAKDFEEPYFGISEEEEGVLRTNFLESYSKTSGKREEISKAE